MNYLRLIVAATAFVILALVFVWGYFVEEKFALNWGLCEPCDCPYVPVPTFQPISNVSGPFLFDSKDDDMPRKRSVEITSTNGTLRLNYSDATWQMCLMAKNQAEDLAEWIEMHYLLGATHISIYDHGSTDNTYEVLKVYLDGSIRKKDPYFPKVELIRWPPREQTEDRLAVDRVYKNDEEHKDVVTKIAICKAGIGLNKMHAGGMCQRAVIADCATRFRRRRDWLTWYDVDEFFWVHQDSSQSNGIDFPTMSTYFTQLPPKEHEFTWAWYITSFTFGPSGYKSRDDYRDKLVVESHLHRAPIGPIGEDEQEIIKTIPGCTKSSDGWNLCARGGGKSLIRAGPNAPWETKHADSPHSLDYGSEFPQASFPIRMNHYQMKSEQEALESSAKQNKQYSYKAATEAADFWNHIYDPELAKLAPEVKKRLKEREALK